LPIRENPRRRPAWIDNSSAGRAGDFVIKDDMGNPIYNFSQEDSEDQLKLKGGIIDSPMDRRFIGHSSILMFVALLVILVIVDTARKAVFGSDPSLIPTVVVAVLLAPCFNTPGTPRYGLFDRYVNNLRGIRDGLSVMIWPRVISLAAFCAAGAFLVVRLRDRYLPLSDAIKIFLPTFVVLLSVEVIGDSSSVVHFMNAFDIPFTSLVTWLSLSEFIVSLRGLAAFPFPIRMVLGLVGIACWLGAYLLLPILLSVGVTIVGMFGITVFTRSRIEHDGTLAPPFVHLTDLHITAAGKETIEEGGLANAEVLELVRNAVNTNQPVLITGDITDSGGRLEWQNFLDVINAVEAERGKPPFVIMAPGNHDIFPYSEAFRPMFSSLPLTSRLQRLRKIRYLAAVAEVCPSMSILPYGTEMLLSDYLATEKAVIESVAGSSSENPYLSDLDRIWDRCFPMFCRSGGTVYVALDTNRVHSNFWTSAFGEVTRQQRERLASLLKMIDRKRFEITVLGHHHLYIPKQQICQDWRLKHLEMVNGRALGKILSNTACYYVHGHRHFEFKFKLRNMTVLSGKSLKFPDQVIGRWGCRWVRHKILRMLSLLRIREAPPALVPDNAHR
jgi:metallophosphoesterase superfamily enzyme